MTKFQFLCICLFLLRYCILTLSGGSSSEGVHMIQLTNAITYIESHSGYGTTTYPGDTRSYWLLDKGANSRQVVVNVLSFHLEDDAPDCGYDYLEFVDESRVIDRICDDDVFNYTMVQSYGRYVLLSFRSDSGTGKPGFRLSASLDDSFVPQNSVL